MKVPSVLKNLLTNRIVLNIVSVLAIFNMIGYLISGYITPVLFFIVLAILITHFSRNMIIVLGIPLILVNLFVMKASSIEGMETNTSSNNTSSNNTSSNNTSSSDTGNSVDMDKIKDAIANKQKSNTTDSSTDKQDSNTKPTDESFEVGRAKKKGGGYDIDYASTVEDAYDQLNSILGSEGIKRLTDDTQKLMKQQMQLAESMKGMGPMIKNMEPMMNQAKSLLEGMDDSNGGLGGIMELAKKFGGSSNQK
jgi:hypothetical protein